MYIIYPFSEEQKLQELKVLNFNINFDVSTLYALGAILLVCLIIVLKIWSMYRNRYKKMKYRRNRIFETSRKTEIKDRLSSF